MGIQNQVKKFREEQGITQEELAIQVDVSRQTINAIETGKYDPSLELALKISGYFDKETEQIFKLEK